MLIADGGEEHSSIPPFNLSAQTAADVYKLDDSILLFLLLLNPVNTVHSAQS